MEQNFVTVTLCIDADFSLFLWVQVPSFLFPFFLSSALLLPLSFFHPSIPLHYSKMTPSYNICKCRALLRIVQCHMFVQLFSVTEKHNNEYVKIP